MTAQATREGEFKAKVQISGYWSIEESDSHKNQLLQENALAILFPYVRSQMTLLTAQPETEPIVWPAMNINKMMTTAESKIIMQNIEQMCSHVSAQYFYNDIAYAYR